MPDNISPSLKLSLNDAVQQLLVSVGINSALIPPNVSDKLFFENTTAVDASNYGLLTTATGSVNRQALSEAIGAAVAAGRTLTIPAGTFEVDIEDTQGVGALPISGTVAIRGAGMGKTIIKGVNYDSSLGAALFRIGSGVYEVEMSDMDIIGPDEADLTGGDQICWGIWIGGGGTVRVTRVHLSMWNQDIKCTP